MPYAGGGADQRRAAHHHGADRVRGLVERRQPRGHVAMRQRGLVDDADRPAVGLEPDGAHGFAVDLHGPLPSRFRPGAELDPATRALAPAARLPQCRAENQLETPMADRRLRNRVQSTAPACRIIAEIFARWARDGRGLSRRDAQSAASAELGLSYGDTPRQTIDLFLPRGRRKAPLALFIHGGYWRSWIRRCFSHMARGLNARGFAVAVVGLRSVPERHYRRHHRADPQRACVFLWQRFSRRMMVYGHSAGGHLTAAMVATDWQELYPKAPSDLVPVGLRDFRRVRSRAACRHQHEPGPAARRGRGARACRRCSGRSRPAACSMPWWASQELSEFKRQSRAIGRCLDERKAETRYEDSPATISP